MNYIAGIDWAARHDEVCILREDEKIVKKFKFDITADGFSHLLEQLDLLGSKKNIKIGIETDKNILADFLLACGYEVYSLNPKKVSRFKERYAMQPQKDDGFDAYSIAMFLIKDRHRFIPVMRSTNSCEELKEHCATMSWLIRQRTRLANRLRADLRAFFPAFSDFFSELQAGVALNSLKALGGPSRFKGSSREEFMEMLKDVKRLGAARKEDLYDHLKRDTIHFDSPREPALIARTSILADQILKLNESIAEQEKTIKGIYEKMSLSGVFSSLPGAGKRNAPEMLSLFGDNKDRFTAYQQVQCYAGTAPVTEKSGKSYCAIKMRRACNKDFRHVFYKFAFCTLSLEPWAKAYYDEQKERGKSHSAAIRALGNKWAKIIFRMWKDEVKYDAEIFLQKRNKFGLVFASS